MNQQTKIDIRHSTCPHDCPSACALDVEVIDGSSIGRVRGSKQQTYTAGVICAKVARYAERIHHPDRLLHPLRRTGPKGSGKFARISWDEALDEIAARFDAAEREFGAESVWPYYYAGTMGLVMRDGINRLAHVKKYSRYYSTICANVARIGFAIGTGKISGVDPREMGVSDLVVIWGANPVNTQVNVMTHATRARKERGAKIAAIDVYNNDTMKQADIKIILRPAPMGPSPAASMHAFFREGFADRAYMDRYTDCPGELEAHQATRTPEWASSISGVPVEEIEALPVWSARPSAPSSASATVLPAAAMGLRRCTRRCAFPPSPAPGNTEGGAASFNNYAIFKFNGSSSRVTTRSTARSGCSINRRSDAFSPAMPRRITDPPVKAMLIEHQSDDGGPEQDLVRKGFAREDCS